MPEHAAQLENLAALLPEARSGDFYLDGLSGRVYVLEEP
jgi:hypothetical protein